MTDASRVRSWGLAVDFGTTATAAVTVIGDDVSLLSLDGGGRMSSSVYASGADGVLLVGKQADNEAGYAPEQYEQTPKRKIDRPSVRLGDRQYAPVELIAAIMAHVLREALGQHNGSAPGWVVLTHPVAWSSWQRQVLADAMQAGARLVGVSLPDPVFVAEPVAAAQWYSLGKNHVPPLPGQKFAVYDLGGGTFDVAILERTATGYIEINTGSIENLGGYDFDHRLFTYLGNRYIAKRDADVWRRLQRPQPGDVEMAEQRRQMRTSVQLLKEQLSWETSRSTRLRGVADPVLVTRDDFEDLIVADVDRTIDEFLTTLDESGLTPSDLAVVYRVGGASRTLLVGRKLEALGAPVHSEDDPKLVVAKGAALTPEVRFEAPPRPKPLPDPEPLPDPDPVPDPDPIPDPKPKPKPKPKPDPDPDPKPEPDPKPRVGSAMGGWAWRSVKTGTAALALATAVSTVGWIVFSTPVLILAVICLVGAVIGALMIRIGSLSSDKSGRGWVLCGVVLVAAAAALLGYRLLLVEFAVYVELGMLTAVLGGLSTLGVLLIVAPQWSRVPGRGAVTGLIMAGVVIVAVDVVAILAASDHCQCSAQVPSDYITIACGIALVVGGIAAGRRRRRVTAGATSA